jgi:GNAT superfamily N-acetyltransferase
LKEGAIWYFLWGRDRLELLPLFELADDSTQHIREYIHTGEVIVAMADELVGHIQIVPGLRKGEFELKSMAVVEHARSLGIGGRLLEAAVSYSRNRSGNRLVVSTAIASFAAMRFYLCRGFRPSRIVLDAFSPSKGYLVDGQLDGVPLRDAIVLEMSLSGAERQIDSSLSSDRGRKLDKPIGRNGDEQALELPIQPGQDKHADREQDDA